MRRLQFLLIVVIAIPIAAFGQVMINNFDDGQPDTAYSRLSESPTEFTLSFDGSDFVGGAGSLKAHASLASVHSWGTYAQVGYTIPDGAAEWDWTISDSVSVWLKVRMAPTSPQNMVFRINIVDRPTPTDVREEWIYENTTVLDALSSGWVNLRIPILERVQPPSNDQNPDSTGFILAPGSWGLPRNNSRLDRDKIVGWAFNIVTTTIDADSVIVSFDEFERFGVRAVPAVVFNGRAFSGNVINVWSWGQSSVAVENGGGPVPNSNAVKWTQGDEYGNGWTGWGTDIDPVFNLAGGWSRDSLKLTIKSETGVGPLRAQFESGADGKRGLVFQPITDGDWHDYSLCLADFVDQDGTTNFDSSMIHTFGLMAEASGIAGKVLYIARIWTGNPEIDVIPPVPPTGLQVNGVNYANLITWNDVPNEPGVRYNVYYYDQPWDSVGDPVVEDVPPYNLQATLTNHILRAPNTDQTISYYYGVTSKDLAGNESTPAVMSAPVATLAKGVPTFSLNPPANFVANGNLSEWTGITPFNLSVETGTAHSVPNFPISGDADLFVKAYLAVDAQYLYVAFDVQDDTVAVDTTGTDYEQDCPDLFIGTYDWRGKHHSGYTGGAHPDYHLRFSKNRIRIDNDGGAIIMYAWQGNPDYIWKEKTLTSGYVVEARISWAQLAAALPNRHDNVFAPREGMRIPINLVTNDRDNVAPGATRAGIMDYSVLSNDNSWSDMFYWTHTWIGNAWTVGVTPTGEIANSYTLAQNYPNPFNPSTRITYSIAKAGQVALKVFDMLGREVATLVNTHQETGEYVVDVDLGRYNLASGVYFYRLEAGSFIATHKMMLLK